MKEKLSAILVGTLLAVLCVTVTQGQAPSVATPVQQVAQRLDAATNCQTSGATGGTLTFTPPGASYFYLTEIDFQNVASGTAVTAAAPTTVTTSNLTGAPTWTMASGTTAGTNTQSFSAAWPTGLKSTTPGTAVVITLPAFATNQVIRANACGYYGQ